MTNSCLPRMEAILIKFLAVPHLICIQVPLRKLLQGVTEVIAPALIVITTTNTVSLVEADGRSLRSMPCMTQNHRSGRTNMRIIAVFTHNCRCLAFNKMLKDNSQQETNHVQDYSSSSQIFHNYYLSIKGLLNC